MAIGIERLLKDDTLRRRLADNAAEDGKERFDLKKPGGRLSRVV